MPTSAHAVTAVAATTMEMITAEGSRGAAAGAFIAEGPASGGNAGWSSDFDVRSQLHHAVGRDVEEVRGAGGVACHPGEQVVAPQRHARRVARRDHGLARQEERGVHDVEAE